MSTEACIQLEQVSFSYGGPRVLENITLNVYDKEFLGIVGPNAGGKSTLLKLILGLLDADQGRIRVLGRSPRSSRNRIGYVAQYPSFPRDFPITVEQAVMLGRVGHSTSGGRRDNLIKCLLPGRYRSEDFDHAYNALHEVEAEKLLHRQIGSLSGGQLQRVLLARALVTEPDILILDEPTANIDQRLESDIFDLLKRINQRMTILVVSHDIAFISSYVTRVACINRTLVCHHTDAIDGEIIQNLYGEDVRMVHHHH
jgi:zinc transport system ATP-binding protein